MGMWLLIHNGIKFKPCQWKGRQRMKHSCGGGGGGGGGSTFLENARDTHETYVWYKKYGMKNI